MRKIVLFLLINGLAFNFSYSQYADISTQGNTWIIQGNDNSGVLSYYGYYINGEYYDTASNYTYKKVFKLSFQPDTSSGYTKWSYPFQIKSTPQLYAYIRQNNGIVYAILLNSTISNGCDTIGKPFILYDWNNTINSTIDLCISTENENDTIKNIVSANSNYYGKTCYFTKNGFIFIQGVGSNKGLFEKIYKESGQDIAYNLFKWGTGNIDVNNLLTIDGLDSLEIFNPPQNFYQFIDEYFTSMSNVKEDSNEFEHGIPDIERDYKIWMPRLFPSGDFEVAAKAITEYGKNFNMSSPCSPISTPIHWSELGPFDVNGKFENCNTPLNGAPGNMGIGHIDKIRFSPGYGTTNQTIYAASNYGGLWKSTNSGNNWFPTGTDNYMQIPQTVVADVAVDYNNPDNVFICSGSGDVSVYDGLGVAQVHMNPEFTYGIFRSTDGGTVLS